MGTGIIGVSGARGFIGSRLVEALEREGYQVWPMVRQKTSNEKKIYYNYKTHEIDSEKLARCSAVIHLAGKNIMSGLWFEKTKNELYDSRVRSTQLIAKAMAELNNGPKILLNGSAVGFYGDRGDEKLFEDSPVGYGFLAHLCKDWERATVGAKKAGIRVVNLRTGAVLDKKGGMIQKMIPLFKLGLGVVLGSGDQFLSPIALDDVVGAIIFALKNPEISGPVNLVCPKPVKNKEFSKNFAQVYNKKVLCSFPRGVLKFFTGEQGGVALNSTRVFPKVLLDNGFCFQYASDREYFANFNN